MNEKEFIELVNRAIAKDNQAMETLYKAYYKDVLYVCKKLSLNDADANDIAQDAFIDAFSKLDSLNDKRKFKQWVCRIANNKAINLLKHNNVLQFEDINGDDSFYEIPDKEISAEQQVIDNEVAETLKDIIEKLPLEQRITVFMYYYEDMSVKDIAFAYNVSENTVRSRLNYAKKFISSEVNKLEDKGVKLRSIAVLPFLYILFAQEGKAFAASIPNSAIPSAPGIIAKVMNNYVANATANGTATAPNLASTTGTDSTPGIATTSTTTSAGITATTTAKVATTATKTGFSLGKIIALSAASVAVVTAAVIGFSAIGNSNDNSNNNKNNSEVISSHVTDNNENISDKNDSSQSTENTTQKVEQEEDYKTGDEYWDYYPMDKIALPEISYTKIEYLQGASGPITANIADTMFTLTTEEITERIKNSEYFKSKEQAYIFTTELEEDCNLKFFSDVGLQKQYDVAELVKAYPKTNVDEVISKEKYSVYDFKCDFRVRLATDYTNYTTPNEIIINLYNIDINRDEQKKIFSYVRDLLGEDIAKFLVYAGTGKNLEENIAIGKTTYTLKREVNIGKKDNPQSGNVMFKVYVTHKDEKGESYYVGNYTSALNSDLFSLDKYILGNFGSTDINELNTFGSEYMKHGLDDVYTRTVSDDCRYRKLNYPDGSTQEIFAINTQKGCDEIALIACPEFDISIHHYSKNNETTNLSIDFEGGIALGYVSEETEPDYTKLYNPFIGKIKALLGDSVDISSIDMTAFIEKKGLKFESTYLGKPCNGTISYTYGTNLAGWLAGEYKISISMIK